MTKDNKRQFTKWHEALLKFLRRVITLSNVWLLKLSDGRIGNSFLGVPVLLLTTTGRKSGQPRTLPLYFLDDAPRYILVASNAGTGRDPAWYLNIQVNPTVVVDVRGQIHKMVAQVVSAEAKAKLWPRLTELFPKWQMMEDRSKRDFPVVILNPKT